MNDVTPTFATAEKSDSKATDQLFSLVYDDLRRLAANRLARERPGQTLQATALVNESYLRLVGPAGDRPWESRGHFFAAVAQAMRRILVENARRKGRAKHGGGRRREQVDLDALLDVGGSPQQVMAVHEALEAFARHDPLKAKLVDLRFFAGLTLEQAAACLDISLSTAERAWRYARAWLYAAMADAVTDEKPPR
jgi:RNA polymerase sigma factor (TIGR02999 family)